MDAATARAAEEAAARAPAVLAAKKAAKAKRAAVRAAKRAAQDAAAEEAEAEAEAAAPAAPTPAPTPAPAPAPASAPATATAAADVLPNPTCLVQAARLAIQQDKPIQLDYYTATAMKTAFIGEDPETKDKVLVKSKEEFTSHIQKLYKVGEDYLVLTENSIYIVSGAVQKRKVNLAALQGDE
jgi:hypothetical protein